MQLLYRQPIKEDKSIILNSIFLKFTKDCPNAVWSCKPLEFVLTVWLLSTAELIAKAIYEIPKIKPSTSNLNE